MADAIVERQQTGRFFCHRCNIEFEDILQDYTCPYCASGFIEQLDTESDGSDADMSNLDDSDEQQGNRHPMLSDIALLMSGRRVGRTRPDSLLEQLMWSLGGARSVGGTGTARAPFVLVGAPGDYVFGGEGLDAVVTQMLGQLENAGPPPLSREQIAAIPTEAVSSEQAATNASCSVCWENFLLDEKVSRLECEHVFHTACIEPWLRLHATCPICRRSLLRAEPTPAGAQPAAPANPAAPAPADGQGAPPVPPPRPPPSLPRVVLRRLPLRLITGHQTHAWDSPAGSGSGSGSGTGSSGGSSVSAGMWANSRSTTSTSNSSSSLHSNTDRDRQQGYNMDIDYD